VFWPFGLKTDRLGDVAFLRLTGELDLAAVGEVEAALDRALDEETSLLVLDLRRLTFLNGSGLKTILRADDRGRREGFDVVVVRPPHPVSRVFTLTRAGERLELVDEPPRVSAPAGPR
jgi:anti-sigma B factor antagonist